jgi:hypothetical protein
MRSSFAGSVSYRQQETGPVAIFQASRDFDLATGHRLMKFFTTLTLEGKGPTNNRARAARIL